MRRVHARWVMAHMINHEPFRDGPILALIRVPVRQDVILPDVKSPISAFVSVPCPVPTGFRFVHEAFEAEFVIVSDSLDFVRISIEPETLIMQVAKIVAVMLFVASFNGAEARLFDFWFSVRISIGVPPAIVGVAQPACQDFLGTEIYCADLWLDDGFTRDTSATSPCCIVRSAHTSSD